VLTVLRHYCEELAYDPCANCKPNFDFKQYLKIEELLAKDKYNLIEKHDIFWKSYKLMVTNFVGWGGYVWDVVGLGNLCCN
jgi:hypothetical protein